MGHWFDDLTKALAQGSVSRRSALRATLAGLAAGSGNLLAAAEPPRPSTAAPPPDQPPGAPQKEGPCVVRFDGQKLVVSLTTQMDFQGSPLTLQHTVTHTLPRENGHSAVRAVITLGNKTLFRADGSGVPPSEGPMYQVRARFGDAFRGVRESSFFSPDGAELQGAIDGRRLLPLAVGAEAKYLRFEDGKPGPVVRVDPSLRSALVALLGKAKQDASKCSYQLPEAAGSSPEGGPPALLGGNTGHSSDPNASALCIACEAGVVAAGVACGLGCIASLCFYGACIAGCGIAELVAYHACHNNGAPCCPVNCGDACCNNGETCLDPDRGICCSKGLVGCAQKSCCHASDTCINANGTCCPKDRIVCNHVCCKKGEVCKDGVMCCKADEKVVHGKCCPDAQVCGDVCCEFQCADSEKGPCCGFSQQACEGKCCGLGEVCVNGKCCSHPCGSECCKSSEVCCGGICCASGETCLDAKAQKCSSCPQGMVGCTPDPPGPGICCAAGVTACCNGSCCKPGQVCCAGGGSGFGCHDNFSQCIS